MNRLETKLGKLTFKNPVTVASGTFSSDYARVTSLHHLGAMVTKTITPEPKIGNPPPRLYETSGGLLNSIGLQNPGIEVFLKDSIPEYKKLLTVSEDYSVPLIVSFSASTNDDFLRTLERLEGVPGIAGYEVNISCPNVAKEGLSFGVDPQAVYKLTSLLNGGRDSQRELIIKLTPNVTDISEIASAAESGGCDSLALINTVIGMAIDWQTGKPYLKRGFGGYSGPSIKPIALYNVFKVAQKTKIPLLAMGGISNYQDALEFFYAGASMVAIGTENFANPLITSEIIDDLELFCQQRNICLTDFIGKTKYLL